MVEPIDSSDLVALYGIEANLIQQKASHVLAIRTLAVSIFVAIIGGIVLYPGHGVQWLSLTLIPFYALDALYDGYLIPIAHREAIIRRELARRIGENSHASELAEAYRDSPDHRFAPARWSHFRRALVEPVRVLLYVVLVAAPVLAVAVIPALS